jgi:HSP20 family protein
MYISPYRRISRLRDAMDRVLEESFTENSPIEREMVLAVDVLAEDDAYLITALVPGLDADDLNIEILNNTVSIRGEFKSDVDENARFITSELPEGRFTRTVSLPVAVDSTQAEANIRNGVLTLRVPKAEAHRPKAIKVTYSHP